VTWAGSILPDQSIVALLAAGGAASSAPLLRGLALIGIDDVRGVFDESALEWQQAQGGLATIPQVSPRAMTADASSHQVIDVRGASELEDGRIPGSINIPLAALADALPSIARVPTIVHCQGGTRSMIAASAMRAAGIEEVSSLAGGFAAWRAAGLPVSRPGRATNPEP
jgi:hydroxyacylglutathione hydrolase